MIWNYLLPVNLLSTLNSSHFLIRNSFWHLRIYLQRKLMPPFIKKTLHIRIEEEHLSPSERNAIRLSAFSSSSSFSLSLSFSNSAYPMIRSPSTSFYHSTYPSTALAATRLDHLLLLYGLSGSGVIRQEALVSTSLPTFYQESLSSPLLAHCKMLHSIPSHPIISFAVHTLLIHTMSPIHSLLLSSSHSDWDCSWG